MAQWVVIRRLALLPWQEKHFRTFAVPVNLKSLPACRCAEWIKENFHVLAANRAFPPGWVADNEFLRDIPLRRVGEILVLRALQDRPCHPSRLAVVHGPVAVTVVNYFPADLLRAITPVQEHPLIFDQRLAAVVQVFHLFLAHFGQPMQRAAPDLAQIPVLFAGPNNNPLRHQIKLVVNNDKQPPGIVLCRRHFVRVPAGLAQFDCQFRVPYRPGAFLIPLLQILLITKKFLALFCPQVSQHHLLAAPCQPLTGPCRPGEPNPARSSPWVGRHVVRRMIQRKSHRRGVIPFPAAMVTLVISLTHDFQFVIRAVRAPDCRLITAFETAIPPRFVLEQWRVQ